MRAPIVAPTDAKLALGGVLPSKGVSAVPREVAHVAAGHVTYVGPGTSGSVGYSKPVCEPAFVRGSLSDHPCRGGSTSDSLPRSSVIRPSTPSSLQRRSKAEAAREVVAALIVAKVIEEAAAQDAVKALVMAELR